MRGNVTKGALLHHLVDRVDALEKRIAVLEQPAAAPLELEQPAAAVLEEKPAPKTPPRKRASRAKK